MQNRYRLTALHCSSDACTVAPAAAYAVPDPPDQAGTGNLLRQWHLKPKKTLEFLCACTAFSSHLNLRVMPAPWHLTAVLMLCCCGAVVMCRQPACAGVLWQPTLQYTLHEVSHDELYGKPQWFTDLHPQGLIPVVAFQQQPGGEGLAAPITAADPGIVAIKESLVCNEYLENAYPQPAVRDATLG